MSAAATQTIEPHHLELPPTAGGLLEATRVATGLTVPEVAACLHISPLEVMALERDQYGAWSAAASVRSIVSAYARVLDLPAGLVLEAFDQNRHRPQLKVTHAEAAEPPTRRGSLALRVSAFSIAAVLMFLAGGVWWQSGEGSQATVAAEPPPVKGSVKGPEPFACGE